MGSVASVPQLRPAGTHPPIGEQQQSNPALDSGRTTPMSTSLIAGLSAYPAYYAHMGVINTKGPAPIDLSMPEPVDPDELRRRIDAGQWVVDLRARTAFAAGHVDGSLGSNCRPASSPISDGFISGACR